MTKTKWNVALGSLLLLCLATSCSAPAIEQRTTTIVIEGCEYLVVENSQRLLQNYSLAITHKGNCKNPIHQHGLKQVSGATWLWMQKESENEQPDSPEQVLMVLYTADGKRWLSAWEPQPTPHS
jgi:hypothetical protein